MPVDLDGTRRSPFSREEHRQRRHAVRQDMAAAGIGTLVVTDPPDLCYLTGLDHAGYFASHMLVLPGDGDPVLVAREMERPTIDAQVPDIELSGYGEDDDPADGLLGMLRALDRSAAIGVQGRRHYLLAEIATRITTAVGGDRIVDASDLVLRRRMVQSPEELALTRRAAAVSRAMTGAAVATAGVGVSEREVAGAMLAAMAATGGDEPALWPLVRSAPRLDEPHTTWTDHVLATGDPLLVEHSGAVARYHAPTGRLIRIDTDPDEAHQVAVAGFEAARDSARTGSTAGDVYRVWQDTVTGMGLRGYRRHNCGYVTGIAFPPSWTGSGTPLGLHAGSGLELDTGMVLHVMSWVTGTPLGDGFVSDTIVVGPSGGRRLGDTAPATPVGSTG